MGYPEVMPRTSFERRCPEVGFGEIAIDLLQARFWIASDWPTNREFNGQNDHCGWDREKQFKDSTTLLDFWIAVVKSQLACRCAA
jgi:hypothetical protein